MPGPTENDPQGGKPKGGKGHAKGKDKGGKAGKGKDKDNKGGKTGNGKGGDKSGTTGKGKDETPPDPNRSCMAFLFGCCSKHGATKLGEHCSPGTRKGGVHRMEPTEAEKKSEIFKSFENRNGKWTPEMPKNQGNARQTPPSSPRPGSTAGN